MITFIKGIAEMELITDYIMIYNGCDLLCIFSIIVNYMYIYICYIYTIVYIIYFIIYKYIYIIK